MQHEISPSLVPIFGIVKKKDEAYGLCSALGKSRRPGYLLFSASRALVLTAKWSMISLGALSQPLQGRGRHITLIMRQPLQEQIFVSSIL